MKPLSEMFVDVEARRQEDAKRYAEHDGDSCQLCGANGHKWVEGWVRRGQEMTP